MGVMRNHEGYHDPTAGRAIRNAARKERRERGRMPCALTYSLGEVRAFRECAKRLP